MKISAQEEYGLRCLVQLAGLRPGDSLTLRRSLSQKASRLRTRTSRCGCSTRRFVLSTRGTKGGYFLARPAGEIHLNEIIKVLGEEAVAKHCESYTGVLDSCVHKGDCGIRPVIVGLHEIVENALSQITLAQIVGTERSVDAMFHSIKGINRVNEPQSPKSMSTAAELLTNREYKYGFVTDIETETIAKGLSEDTVRLISSKKNEPEWMLEFRLKAYRKWLTMEQPDNWANFDYPNIDFQNISYYSAPKEKEKKGSLDEVDPELLKTFEKLGIPITEQKMLANVAVDAVFDSVSVATTYKKKLLEAGVIFCSFTEAVELYPDKIQKYLGSVVPVGDNYYAALNSAVFSDGSFVFIPKGVRCPMELSTYFRINTQEAGQFERTLIVAEEGGYVAYNEGCTAPQFDTNQLHAAVVELVALDDAEIKYSTVQNWYAGDETGKGGIYNFVTKRGACRGVNSKISWTQVETGSAITWKYPSVILQGDNSIGEFYSVALTNNAQIADTGTKMIHLGKNTKSTIISKGISAGKSNNSYRGLVKIMPKAEGARNYTQCDSMLIGGSSEANTFPYIEVMNNTARVEHEATTSKISEDQLFYLQQRGISQEDAVSLIINGFCKEVFRELPMEYAVEATKLLGLKLEGSVG